jgi:hypothetical protein
VTNYGDKVILTFNAQDGWELFEVIVNNEKVVISDNTLILNYVEYNLEIRAVFKEKIKTFKVSVNCNEHGTVDVQSTTEVEYGSSLTINITPNEDCEIASIKVNGTEVEITSTLSLESITSDTDVIIEFKQKPVKSPCENPEEQPESPDDNTDKSTITWIIVGSALSALLIASAITIPLVLKKKRNK